MYLASHRTTHSPSFIHCIGYPTFGVTPPPVISSASQRVTPSVISSASVSHPVGNFISQSMSHSVSRSADSRWVTRQKFHQATNESPRQLFRPPAWVTPSVIPSASQWFTPSVVRQTAGESPVRNFIGQPVSHPVRHFVPQRESPRR